MAVSLSLLLFLPLLPIYALPPGVVISNGEIAPAVGAATACSTITTTIGTRVDVIPVPCASSGAALPPTFTEEVMVGVTSAALVVGHGGDVEFLSEPWLDAPTATPASSNPLSSAVSSIPSKKSSAGGQPATSAASAPAGSSSSSPSQSTSAGGHSAVSGSSGPSGSASYTPSKVQSGGTQTGSSSASIVSAGKSGLQSRVSGSPSATASNGVVSGSQAGTQSQGSSGPSVTSSHGSVSGSLLGAQSQASSPPSVGPGNSQTNAGSGSSALSESQKSSSKSGGTSIPVVTPAGSQTGSQIGSQTGSLTGANTKSLAGGLSSQTSSLASQAPNSTVGQTNSVPSSPSSVSESASHAQSRSSISSPTESTAGSTGVTAAPGSKTTAVGSVTLAPLSAGEPISGAPTASTTIPPTGAIAKASASALQSSIGLIIPIVQSYIDNPGSDQSTAAINALKGVLPLAEELSDEIGPPPNPKSCSVSVNLIADIFNAASCAGEITSSIISGVEAGEDAVDTVTAELANLGDLQKPLDDDSEEDDDSTTDKSDTQESKTQDSSTESKGSSTTPASTSASLSSAQSSASQKSSASSKVSSSISSAVSSTSSSVSSSVSSTISSSSGCALPPEITLPADSTTGIAQPDQPTSVDVTGLVTYEESGAVTGVSNTGSGTGAGTSTLGSDSAVTRTTAPQTTAPASTTAGGTTAALASTPLPDCMADGAPWYSPTSWCDCGASAKYPTLPPTSGMSTANCDYTSLPSATINPISVSAAPTNVPGQNGLPGCNYVLYPDGQGCPYANYCDCGGTYVGLLTATVSGTTSLNCDYTIQPTANNCPTPTTTIVAPSTPPAVPATSAASAPSSTAPAAPTCTMETSVGGRGIITSRTCNCNYSPAPSPTISNDEYSCPNQVASIGKRGEGNMDRFKLVDW